MRFRKGHEYRVLLRDHAEGGRSYEFIVMGRCIAVRRNEVVLATWFYGTDSDFNLDDTNVEKFTVIKKAIIESWEITD